MELHYIKCIIYLFIFTGSFIFMSITHIVFIGQLLFRGKLLIDTHDIDTVHGVRP